VIDLNYFTGPFLGPELSEVSVFLINYFTGPFLGPELSEVSSFEKTN